MLYSLLFKPLFNDIKKGIHFLMEVVRPKDELVGIWKTEDDGGIHMIFGQAIEFKSNHLGCYSAWSNTDPEPFNEEINFTWNRLSRNSILLLTDKSKEEATRIDYIIESYIGTYNIKYRRMTSSNYVKSEFFKEGFWKVNEALLIAD